MFPDEFTFNILIDSYLKDEDYKGMSNNEKLEIWLGYCFTASITAWFIKLLRNLY